MFELFVPGDKSITHRALLLAAMARGTSRLVGLQSGKDAQATARVLRAVGVAVPPLPPDGRAILVPGVGGDGLVAPAQVLECGNSGTTARLLLGLLAGIPLAATLTGDVSLRSRPMRRVTGPLGRMGARFDELGVPDRLPIRVTGGALRSLDYASPQASGQIKSALLLAGVSGRVTVCVREPVRSRDHTERMLRAMDADIRITQQAGTAPAVVLRPTVALESLDLHVPGDFSAAAFFLALALLAGAGELRVRAVGVNPTRTGFLEVVRRMGGRIAVEDEYQTGGEPAADLVVRASPLQATTVEGAELPSLIDEVPIVAILAARARGETCITGAAELRVKESDRLAALAANLRAVGVAAEERPDGLVVCGTEAPLRGRVRTFGDHRIAMAFGVLAALPGNTIEIAEPAVAAISFPDYWRLLERASSALYGR